jgi:hypothetical protein
MAFAVLVAAAVTLGGPLPSGPADAAPKCRGPKCADTTPPALTITTPTAGSSVSGTVSVTGTSSDNAAVATVSLSVDGGAWTPASGVGAWSWSWSTTAALNGSHSIVARAVDTSGNVATSTVPVTVANAVPDTTPPTIAFASPDAGASVSGTVSVSGSAADNASVTKVEVRVDNGSWTVASGTASWSWSWATSGAAEGTHTLTARATDGAGNTTAAARSVTVPATPPPPPSGVWTSPEGVKIDIQTTSGGWTPNTIYAMLTANALDLARIGPGLTIVVQDTKPTLSTIAASSVNGRYTSVSATIQLDASPVSSFSIGPDDILTHEYGHVWNNYNVYVKWQGDWSAYLSKRWTATDGSVTLATDSRTGSSYIWTPDEIAADDYRLLFGSSQAIAQRNASLNQRIPDPRTQPGLRDWFLSTWAS